VRLIYQQTGTGLQSHELARYHEVICHVVEFYKRGNLQVPYDDEYTIEYSDRTEYSAYAERCRDDTELGRGLTKEAVENVPQRFCINSST